MATIKHPGDRLTPEWTKLIRSEALAAEQQRRLTPAQLQLLYEQKWFSLLTPKIYGGLEWSLPEVVAFEEAIGWADGSVAWVLTLCTGAGWFAGFLQPQLAQQLFANPQVCLAGSGARAGTAVITPAGYEISGTWLHASGAPHATAFTANCTIIENGEPVPDEQGNPLVKPFVLFPDEVQLLPTWKSFGLVASASHAFTAAHVTVTPERCFAIDKNAAPVPGPLYQYPFLQLAETTLAANISGMVLHFIEEAEALLLARQKHNTMALAGPVIQAAKQTLQTLRTAFYAALQQSWEQQEQQGCISEAVLTEVSRSSRELAQQGRRAVDELYPYCGLQAAASDTVINQVWRDLHTASQHGLLIYPH